MSKKYKGNNIDKMGFEYNSKDKRSKAKQLAEHYSSQFAAQRDAEYAEKAANRKQRRAEREEKQLRRRDQKVISQLNYGAWNRRFQEKQYNKAKGQEGFDAANHADYLNQTGAFSQKHMDAWNDYNQNKRKYNQNPGLLAEKYGITSNRIKRSERSNDLFA